MGIIENRLSIPSDALFLAQLGQRVRKIRARRGMSRRLLAQSADVSERYLAQLEAGKGNVSILLLRQIARAMGVAIEQLVDEVEDRSSAYEMLRDYLRHCDEEQLQRMQSFALTQNSNTRPNAILRDQRIGLIGLRGAGKTTIGKKLADATNLPFRELTQTIESIAGMDLAEIFSLGGQSSYRQFEQQAVTNLLTELERGVIAVGGSVVSETTTFETLLNSCTTIWLRAAPEDHMTRVVAQGDHRPMEGNRHAMDELKRILAEREALYQRADIIINTHGKSVEQTMEEITELAIVQNLLKTSHASN